MYAEDLGDGRFVDGLDGLPKHLHLLNGREAVDHAVERVSLLVAEDQTGDLSDAELLAGKEPEEADVDLAAALAHFDPVWDVLFPREKRRILGLLVERIEWDRAGGTIDIIFKPAGVRTLAAEAGAPVATEAR